jgi:acetylornithine deacetylase/succinyl-diaminopimelate desuccinylase-like protein
MPFEIPQPQSYRDEALAHLRNLIRIDTSNPPGNELAAAQYVADALAKEGLDPKVFESAPGRGNVWCRIKGGGTGRPVMLIAHLDTVPAQAEGWTHPPREAVVADGCVWGRGALDMKNMAAMSLTSMLVLKKAGFSPARDLVLCFTADEEAGGALGAGWMVDNQPDLVRAEYALGEVGGFSIETPGRRVYPVMNAEKGVARLNVKAKGEGGHGSMPVRDNAISKLGIAAYRLSRLPLPARVTPAAAGFIRTLARATGGVRGAVMRLMLVPALTDIIIDHLVRDPEQQRFLRAVLHDTVSPTVVRAGEPVNVIPTEAEMQLDGRFLPGVKIEEFVEEVADALGPLVTVEAAGYGPPIETPADTPLFSAIERAISEYDPGAVTAPYLLTGYTDAKHYARLGVRTYGFTPLKLPPGFPFARLFHAVDERIPLDGFCEGTGVLLKLCADFCGQKQD